MNYLKTPWTSQPQQAVGIDWSNPIANGLVDAFISDRTAKNVSVVNTNVTRRISQSGVSKRYSGSSYSEFQSPILDLGTSAFSISFRFWLSAVNGTIFGNNRSGTASGILISNAGSNLTINTAASFATSLSTSGVNIADDKEHFVTITRSSSGVYQWYVDGVANSTATTTAFNISNGFLPLLGAQRTTGSPSNYLNGSINELIIHRRDISAQEARSLSQNPWQIFKPIPRRIFAPVSAASGDGTGTGSFYDVTLSFPTGTASGTGASNGTGTGDFASSSLASPSATATGSALATGSLPAVSTTAPSATATGSALATGALTAVTLTTITASATGSALATGSLDAIDLSTVSGSATGTTAGNAEGVGSVATIALSAPTASAVGSALATGSFAHVSLSAVSGTASAATDGQATADLQPISISAPLAIAIASSVATGGIQSIGLTAPTGSASGQAQTIARPGTDASNSGWTPSTGSDLYAMLDEVTPDDADYISTTSAGSVCRLGLGAVADPGTSSGQVVSYRASSSTGNGLLVELMQGGTVIATWNHASLPATDTTYQQSLSSAECDAITDYTALSVRLTSL